MPKRKTNLAEICFTAHLLMKMLQIMGFRVLAVDSIFSNWLLLQSSKVAVCNFYNGSPMYLLQSSKRRIENEGC